MRRSNERRSPLYDHPRSKKAEDAPKKAEAAAEDKAKAEEAEATAKKAAEKKEE